MDGLTAIGQDEGNYVYRNCRSQPIATIANYLTGEAKHAESSINTIQLSMENIS